jgi:hypothetical protein
VDDGAVVAGGAVVDTVVGAGRAFVVVVVSIGMVSSWVGGALVDAVSPHAASNSAPPTASQRQLLRFWIRM